MNRKASGTGYAVLAVIATIWLFVLALPMVVTAAKKFPPDGKSDWLSAQSFAEGRNPYSPEGLRADGESTYGHPPTTALWFLPLIRFPVAESALPLGLFMLFLLLLHTQLLARELAYPVPVVTGVLGFALMLGTVCIRSHLHAGQVSELIAFLYVLCWYFLRRENDVAAGAMLGLACTLKLFPGLMVVFLLARRRWRGVVAAAAVYVGAAIIVTTRFGVDSWFQFLALQGPTARGWIGAIQNASLQGIVLRLFAPSCGDVAASPTPVTTAIIVVVSAALLVAAWRVTRRLPVDFAFVLFSVLSLFLNTWVWEHYYVFYLLPLAVVLSELAALYARGAPRARLALAAGAALCAAALLALDTSIPMMARLKGEYHAKRTWPTHVWLHFYEVGNWMPAVLLMGVLGWIAVNKARPQPLDARELPPLGAGGRESAALVEALPESAALAIVVALVVLLAVRQSGLVAAGSWADLDTHGEYAVVGAQSDKCVEPSGDAAAAGAPLQIAACTRGARQRYRLEPRGRRRFRLRNVETQLCVDVADDSEEVGAPVVLAPCADSNNHEMWTFKRLADGAFEIVSHSGNVFDVMGATTADGARLEQFFSNDGANQRFRLQRPDEIPLPQAPATGLPP